MGKGRGFWVLIGAVVAGVVIWLSLFTVQQWELSALFRLGRIVRADFEPGLHLKLPLIESVRKFDGRILNLDADPERYLTSEKKNVIVDSFVKWRVARDNVAAFYTSVGGDEARANQRLDQIIKDGLRSEVSKRTLQEVVSGERDQIVSVLTVDANRSAQGLGIDVVDVRIKRIDLPTQVSESVYRRMRAERERVARDFRSRGAEAAERIRADADRQRTVLLAEAYRDAETARGEGDRKAADIYAKAYNQSPEFFVFSRSLTSYKSVFDKPNDILILEPDTDYFRYFGSPISAD
jgi:membrane protease subunit HflC